MVDRYLSKRFGVNSFNGVWENDVYGRTDDGRRMEDGCPRDERSSAVR